MSVADNPSLLRAEAEVQAHSSALRRELGIIDLIFAQILLVIVPDFFGTAVKAGPSHVILWLLAIFLFFIPLALIVAHLNRLMPLEGGLYEWARLAFNDQIGFLVAWNLWLFVILYVAVIGVVTVSFATYVVPHLAWMAANKWFILMASAGWMAVMSFVAARGLRLGKWVSNTGGFVILITIAVLVLAPWLNLWRGHLSEFHPLRLVRPPATLFSLSVFSKLSFGALSGFEYIAIFAGECHSPKRNLSRSILITAPMIALTYVLATSSILAFVTPESVDVVAPIPQALNLGAGAFGLAKVVVPLAIISLFINYPTTFSTYFSGSVRLPMAAGWDHLLPEWFSRLHPRHKTPVNSIVFVGAATLAASIAALIGVGPQEAYELLLTWGFTFYAIAYLALFAIPFLSPKDRGLRPGLWLRMAAVSGFLITLLSVILSVFPIIEVGSSSHYSLKIALVVIGANVLGWMIYRAGRQKAARTSA
ncbi:MAG TPA: APC family permease [Verrucomicrobiae bacterium]|nr:APC family permease [Verrucomicrobiae bacterium]